VFNFFTNPARKGSNSVENLLSGSKRIIKKARDGFANEWTVSCDLTIGTYTFNMKGLKYYKLIHQMKKKSLKVLNFHILLKNTTTQFFRYFILFSNFRCMNAVFQYKKIDVYRLSYKTISTC
jgi:hypothetical protein